MENISSWASGIIISVILSTLIEMIIPDGKNKKYIKTIIGIFILFTIIAPIVSNFTNKNIDFDAILASSNYKYNEVDLNSINTDSTILDTYDNKLKEEIKEKLNNKGYEVQNINLEIGKQKNDYGIINKVTLNISKKENKNEIKEINEIQINTKNKNINEEKKLDEAEIKEIVNYLSSEYQIDKNNIKVN